MLLYCWCFVFDQSVKFGVRGGGGGEHAPSKKVVQFHHSTAVWSKLTCDTWRQWKLNFNRLKEVLSGILGKAKQRAGNSLRIVCDLL